MKVRFVLTPSNRIQGLPQPIPQANDTAEVDDDLGQWLVTRNIATAIMTRQKQKLKAVPPKPAIEEIQKPALAEHSQKKERE